MSIAATNSARMNSALDSVESMVNTLAKRDAAGDPRAHRFRATDAEQDEMPGKVGAALNITSIISSIIRSQIVT